LNICGSRIKESREALKMAQAELAAAMKVDFQIKIDRSDISEIERGVRGLKDYELFAIAIILNVSPVWLLCGEE
jgi:transcriptional regulator with XRE-family HTH domain